ncbi:MAG: hypothetical protein AB7F59_14940 [Bdellovibrionales bacterium]
MKAPYLFVTTLVNFGLVASCAMTTPRNTASFSSQAMVSPEAKVAEWVRHDCVGCFVLSINAYDGIVFAKDMGLGRKLQKINIKIHD